jgi:tetratricopeptide (TPR) repeat protein
MSNGPFATFTDRREAVALFNFLRGRDPGKPWPLLPILTFIAPGGSGKSLLLRYLREKECSVSGRAALPFAYLDFTLSHAPKELLPILIELRDQLQKQADGEGRHLVFPRFDLGAMIAQSASSNSDITSFSPTQVRNELSSGVQIIQSIGDLGSSLGNTIPYVAPFLAGLQLASQIKPVKELLSYLEDSTGWKWYRMHGTQTGIGANATMRDVLLRLQILSMIGRPERDVLVNELLPAAFIADIFDALLETDPPRAWSKTANLLFFLDGFEALQSTPGSSATRLLQVLTTVQRISGKTDPLLIVIGSREYLTKSEEGAAQRVPFARMGVQDKQEVQRCVETWHTQWQQHIPADKHFLRLKDLALTVELTDFGQEDTKTYLLKFGEQRQTQVFADDSVLIQTIDQATHGHPLYLALAAEAVLEARARGRHLTPNDFELAEVSPVIGAEHEDERIRDYLLNLFLRQLSETERKELIFCAVPRFLDFALLRVLLPASDDLDRKQRWNHYQRLMFMRPTENQRIVFHPLVRTLLLRQLPADSEPKSDYYQIQTRLKDYFRVLSEKQRANPTQVNDAMQTKIEEAYHALALGDPDLAIVLGIFAQQNNLTIWEPLLDVVAQSSSELVPDDTEQQAYESLERAMEQHDGRDVIKAIILYIWLLTQSKSAPEERASIQNNLGAAYRNLPGGDRAENLSRAIGCFEAALLVRTREAFPVNWAMTQNNLGTAYSDLPGGDQAANLSRAIACYQAALLVYTREAFPVDWAATQNNLGNAYRTLPTGDQAANLSQAITCYQAALLVYTREAFPVNWAATQNNLGEAYRTLPTGDRATNLSQAIACYQAALQIFQQAHAYYASVVNKNVEIARNELQNLASGEE